MLSSLTRYWWVFVVRGIAAVLFGIAAIAWPGLTLVALVWLFGAYLLVDGVSNLVALAAGDPDARRNGWAVALSGVVSIALGIASFVWTDSVALSLLYVVALWAIVAGILEIVGAIYLRREIEGEFWLALGGVASIVFGIVLIAFPAGGLLSLVWIVAFWAFVYGFTSFGLALRLRQLNNSTVTGAPATL